MILLTFLDRQNEIALKPGGVIQLSGFIKNILICAAKMNESLMVKY